MSDTVRNLHGWFYGLMEGLPGTTVSIRTKAWSKRDHAERHVEELTRRHPSAKCLGLYRVAGSLPSDNDLVVG